MPIIMNEDEILDEAVRKKIIEEFIDDGANETRKAEAFKAHECLKDKTVNYVLDLLLKQFEAKTVHEMQYATANISFFRKVIEKLAKVYSLGVKRTLDGKKDTQNLEAIAKILEFDDAMKKINRYFRAFKNTLAFPHPVELEDGKFTLTVDALPPFMYDVIENPKNKKLPLVVILSDYVPKRPTLYAIGDAARAGRPAAPELTDKQIKNGEGVLTRSYNPTAAKKKEKALAAKEDGRHFVWWSKNYHFTTNVKGKIVGEVEPGNKNVLGELPFVNFAGDQDNCFWADGGEDLVDAGIKINTMITNVQHVAITQGYGQLFMTGKNLPKAVKTGPNHCVQLEQAEGEPAPQIGFINSNPPLAELKNLIEMYVALMLTTNNLSTSGFALSLQGGRDFASGVALMIDKSESIEDVGEQQAVFVKNEPKIWSKLKRWYEVYKAKGLLAEEVDSLKFPSEPESLTLQFPSPKPVLSEKEQLEILEKRKELGLNTEIEILMRDDPSLTEEAAEKKLAAILEEKIKAQAAMVANAAGLADGGAPNPEDPNGGGPKPPGGSASSKGGAPDAGSREESRPKKGGGTERVLVSNKTGKVIRVLG